MHRKRFVMRSIFRLVFFYPQVFVKFFKWDSLNAYLDNNTDLFTLAYCAHALSFIVQMSDENRHAFILKYVPIELINLDTEELLIDDKESLTLIP